MKSCEPNEIIAPWDGRYLTPYKPNTNKLTEERTFDQKYTLNLNSKIKLIKNSTGYFRTKLKINVLQKLGGINPMSINPRDDRYLSQGNCIIK